MAWTEITRAPYARKGQRYASDITDMEWALIAPFIPMASKVGRPRKWALREIWDAIQYIAATGCQWAMLPKTFPPFTAVQHWFYRLRDNGIEPSTVAVNPAVEEVLKDNVEEGVKQLNLLFSTSPADFLK